jgi:hypothetical protein
MAHLPSAKSLMGQVGAAVHVQRLGFTPNLNRSKVCPRQRNLWEASGLILSAVEK